MCEHEPKCSEEREVRDRCGDARILTLSFEEVPTVFLNQPSGFSFIGGFDAPETAFDHNQDTSFLVLLSPAANASEMSTQFGSIDLV